MSGWWFWVARWIVPSIFSPSQLALCSWLTAAHSGRPMKCRIRPTTGCIQLRSGGIQNEALIKWVWYIVYKSIKEKYFHIHQSSPPIMYQLTVDSNDLCYDLSRIYNVNDFDQMNQNEIKIWRIHVGVPKLVMKTATSFSINWVRFSMGRHIFMQTNLIWSSPIMY